MCCQRNFYNCDDCFEHQKALVARYHEKARKALEAVDERDGEEGNGEGGRKKCGSEKGGGEVNEDVDVKLEEGEILEG